MTRVIIVRPGSTEFDEQGRIKGCLNIPLSAHGCEQANRTADELHEQAIEAVYSAPCESAQETARRLATACSVKMKVVDKLLNLDLGLWNGKRVEELKATQPKLYRQWQDHPETVCPPNGEMLEGARDRVRKSLRKLLRKYREGTIAIVVPEPIASIVISFLSASDLGDLWKAEHVCGQWDAIEVDTAVVPAP